MPGLSATAVPAGRSPDGLPVGVQLTGPAFEDRTPLRLAELLEPRIGGCQAPQQVAPPTWIHTRAPGPGLLDFTHVRSGQRADTRRGER